MSITVLFAARPELWDDYAPHLPGAFEAAGLEADIARNHAPEDVDYIDVMPRQISIGKPM